MNNRFKALCFLFIFAAAPAAVSAQFFVKSANRAELDSLILSHPALPNPQILLAEKPEQIEPDSLPNPDSMNMAQVVFHTFRLADWAVSLENSFSQSTTRATYARKGLEDELSLAKSDKAFPIENLKELKNADFQLKNLEKTAKKRQKQATAAADFGLKVSKMETDLMRKNLPKLHAQVMDLVKLSKENAVLQSAIDLNAAVSANFPKPKTVAEMLSNAENQTAPDSIKPEKTKVKKSKTKKPKSQKPEIEIVEIEKNPSTEKPVEIPVAEPTVSEILKSTEIKIGQKNPISKKEILKYDPKLDVMLNPSARPCQFLFQGKDEFSGTFRKDLKREEWFSFTNDFMKSVLAGKPHITCDAQISATGTMVLLNLHFTILEQNARKTFGGFNKGSQAILKLIDGTAFTLSNLRQDGGETDDSGKVTTFFAQFALDKTLMKKLKQIEVDKIRVAWNRGFEDYEIYNVDLLQRQLKCLD